MVKALGNHKKVLSRGKDMVCLGLGKDLTLFFSMSLGSERTQLPWVRAKTSDWWEQG